jgi:Cof subfamily protein (haloacid dehalogenase superfamily)
MKRFSTLYVSDLDGTLFDETSRVPEESLRILNSLIKQGAMFTIATARTQATVQPLLQGLLPATTPSGRDIPAIIMTGAGYWNRRLERFDYLRMMSNNDAKTVLQEFRKAGVEPFQYCAASDRLLNVYHAAQLTPREEAFYEERRNLTLKKFYIGEENPALPTVLFFAMGEAEKMEKICKEINSKTRCSAAWYRDIFNPEVALMDVYCSGCSKAVAIKDVAAELGADRIVVFGDNLNDLPMMRVADVAVAMENALPQVKAEADVVIGPNTVPSVANFVLKDFNGE